MSINTSRCEMLLRDSLRKCLRMFSYVSIREREKEFILGNIPCDSPKVILDVGCSGSLLPEQLSKRGHEVFGLDVQDYPKPKGFTFMKGDIITTDLPFGEQMFDYIISLSTIEHIGLGYYGDKRDEQGDRIVLEKLFFFLKNKGRLLITLPFAGNYSQDKFQRIHNKKSFQRIIDGLYQVEKEQFWIPLAKRKWIPASVAEAEKIHRSYPESNNACFVLKKAAR